ncbi:MAG: hypothetical protein ACP5CD_00905 [Thermovirgaceae bacterium]
MIFLVGTFSTAEAVVRSIRTGMQPKGPRIAIDLDEAADYGVIKKDKRLYIQVKSRPSQGLSRTGKLPSNDLVQGFHIFSEGEDTIIEVVLHGKDLEFRHFTMSRPDRIVIDFFHSGEQPPPLPQPVGMVPATRQSEATGQEKTFEERLGLVRSREVDEGFVENLGIPLTAKELVFDESKEAQGFEFVIPRDWKIMKGCSVELVLSGTWPVGLLAPPLDVFLNGFPLEVISIEERDGREKIATFTMPPRRLKAGANRLVLFGGGRESGCGLLVKADSRIFLNARLKHDLRLSDFPGAFSSGETKRRTVIVIPEGFSAEVYEAGLRLMQALQQDGRNMTPSAERPLPEIVAFPVLKSKVLAGKDLSGDHMIFLGDFDSFGEMVASAFGIPEKAMGKKAFLSCFSNREGASRLLVASETTGILAEATKRFLQGKSEDGLDRSQTWIETAGIPSREDGKEQSVQQEKEMTIPITEEETLFKGEGRHTRTFTLDMGFLPETAKDSRLGVIVRHSPRLDREASWITFTVNGRKSEPVALDFPGMGKKMLVLPVIPGKNERFLDVAMEVTLEARQSSAANSAWEPWCVLEREGKIVFLLGEMSPEPFLENITAFIRGKALTVYAAKSVDETALNMLNSFLAGLKGLWGNPPEIFVRPLDVYPGTQRKEPRLVLGRADEILGMDIPLAVGYDEKNLRFFSSPLRISVPEGYAKKSVLFQLFEGDGKSLLLVVTWPSEIPWSESFQKTLLEGKIEGSICLVNEEGETAPRIARLRETFKTGKFDGGFLLGFFIIAASGVLFGLMYLFMKHRTKS